MGYFHIFCFAFVSLATAQFNPTILQDSRDLPKVDGTFGFLYRTEDGIAHAAKGDSDGVVHGRFTYTDPTGLKVNYNYNAGSRVSPGYKYDDPPIPRYQPAEKQYQQPDEGQYEEPQEYREPPQEVQPQPKYTPQRRTSAVRPQVRRAHQYSAQYREPVENYQPQRRTRPPYANRNEVFEEYN